MPIFALFIILLSFRTGLFGDTGAMVSGRRQVVVRYDRYMKFLGRQHCGGCYAEFMEELIEN